MDIRTHIFYKDREFVSIVESITDAEFLNLIAEAPLAHQDVFMIQTAEPKYTFWYLPPEVMKEAIIGIEVLSGMEERDQK